MDIIREMMKYEPEMTGSERKVYDTIKDDPSMVIRFSISQIAQLADTSTSAVLRFCQRLGFRGYKDFCYAVLDWNRNSEKEERETDLVSFLAEQYADTIRSLKDLDRVRLSRLCSDIISAEKTVVLGRYRTSTVAEKLRMNLTDLGITCISGSDLIAYQHLLSVIDEKTCVIMFSSFGNIGGEGGLPKSFPEQLQTHCGRTWLITTSSSAQLSAYMKDTILLPGFRMKNNVSSSSQSIMMIFSEILTSLLSVNQTSV